MQIAFSPMRRDDGFSAVVAGDMLTIDGEAFDFSALPEGGLLPRAAVACEWLASDVTRRGGEIRLTLIAPHGADAPPAALFPEPVTVTEGPVPLPPRQAGAQA